MTKKYLNAFQVIETKIIDEKTNKPVTLWNKIGVGFINKDKSINVQLNSFPINGEFQLREPKDDS